MATAPSCSGRDYLCPECPDLPPMTIDESHDHAVAEHPERIQTRLLAQPFTAGQCPECKVWVYCANGPFAEDNDPTKPLADWLHWQAEHMSREDRIQAAAASLAAEIRGHEVGSVEDYHDVCDANEAIIDVVTAAGLEIWLRDSGDPELVNGGADADLLNAVTALADDILSGDATAAVGFPYFAWNMDPVEAVWEGRARAAVARAGR